MTYTPTPTERKQDKALVEFLEALQKNGCLAGQASTCSISGGARTKRGRTSKSKAKHAEVEQSDDSESESEESRSSPSQTRSKKPTPIKKKAERECEKEEEWMQYLNIARVLIISGTVGAGALAMTGVFSGYADAMMETLGYGSISRVCGEGNYLLNYGASRVIPGMKSCAEVTRMQQDVIAKAWGGVVAIAAAFKISMPQNFSATPGAMIDGLAKMLCRFFKERELHNELMQKIAARNSGISQADVQRAIQEALAAQQAQMQAQQQPVHQSRSPSRSRRGHAAAEEQHSPSHPKQERSTKKSKTPSAQASSTSQSPNDSPQSVESGEESDEGGKARSPSHKKKSKKRSSHKKHRRSTRKHNKSKSKGGKRLKGYKTRSKNHKKKRCTYRTRN